MGYKTTKGGKIVRVTLPKKLPKSIIEAVENNPKGDTILQKGILALKSLPIHYAY